MMTKREREIWEMVRANPTLSQDDLAAVFGISRSSVAVHLSRLTKKGHIVGRGYLVSDKPYVCIVGGAIIDLAGYPDKALKPGDSNKGHIRTSTGGVGRNIAEILARMGVRTNLVTVFGDDLHAGLLQKSCEQLGIDISDSLFQADTNTSVHMAVMNTDNDLFIAVSDIRLFEAITPGFIRSKQSTITHAKVVVVDTNMSHDTIRATLNFVKDNKTLVDTVSGATVERIRDLLPQIDALKINLLEAEMLSHQTISDDRQLEQAAAGIRSKGVKNLYISMGADGLFFAGDDDCGFLDAPDVEVVNTNGAGDALCAGIVLGMLHDQDTRACANLGLQCAGFALVHQDTVNPDIHPNCLKLTPS